MLNIIAVVFVFSFLVIVHELGHFLAAKWMGVRVDKFSIGFPPTVYSKKIGETEFSISAIPLGGFVKMAGFIDESLDENVTGADYEFNSKPVWRRIVIISAGVVMNLVTAIAIMAFLTYSEGEQRIPTTSVAAVPEQGIASQIGFKERDKILAINGTPVYSWNEIQDVFLQNLNTQIFFDVLRDGKQITLEYKKEWFGEKGGELLNIVPLFSAKVGDVTASMPAGKLGLKKGDTIISIAGQPVSDWMEMTEAIRAHPDEEIEITYQRDGQTLHGNIKPHAFEEKTEDGKIVRIGKIGVGYYYEHLKVGLGRSILAGFVRTWDLMALNVRSIYWVVSGTKSAKEIIGGPIMIAKMAGDAAHAGWTYLWYLIAALSAMLAFFNILPIPALDGGHLFFLLIEGIMGRPLPIKVKLKIQQIGMAILLSLIILVVYVDLSRLFF